MAAELWHMVLSHMVPLSVAIQTRGNGEHDACQSVSTTRSGAVDSDAVTLALPCEEGGG